MGRLSELIGRLAGRATEFRRISAALLIEICWLAGCAVLSMPTTAAQTAAQQPAQAKAVGAIKSISGRSIVLSSDDGSDVNISVSDTSRIVRIAPGQTDLKNATPITLSDLQVGDRILARGKASDDAKSLTTTTVIVMKQSDVSAKQQKERDDWQKRGIGGLVSAVDLEAGTVTISVTTLAGSKKVLIQTTKKTLVRRYAPNSVRFDDAKPSKLTDIHAGDQLRARGNKNSDGTEFAAEEIVAGTFRNIAGTVTVANASDNSLTVMDLLTKKPVVVKVSTESQLRKLPPMMAQGIAMRLKGQSPGGQAAAAGGAPNMAAAKPEGATAAARSAAGPPPGGPPAGAGGGYGGGNGGGRGDLQQMLSRLPAVAVSDFQKGDAVILVSTEGTDSGVTAITLVGGVEAILTAAPAGSQAMTLSPWSLSGGAAEGPAQ